MSKLRFPNVLARKVEIIDRAGHRTFQYESFTTTGRVICRVDFRDEASVDELLADCGHAIALPLRRYPEGELHAARYAA